MGPTSGRHNMIAAFLKTIDGDFNYPVALMSLFLIFVIAGIALELIKAPNRGRIRFSWRSSQFWVERAGNPAGFWFLYALYCLCVILFVALIIIISLGLLRKSA
jgi:hypothetical protein